MTLILRLLALLLIPTQVLAAGVADLSNKETSSGLKEMLVKGAEAAVSRLGIENGFSGNPKIRIPLPESLRKVEAVMRSIGMDKPVDELTLRMNRAAEAAVPEARVLLVDAVKMTVQDAKGILTGGDDAATQYFKRTTSEPLGKRFLPIVKTSMEKVQLAEKYNEFAERGAKFGLVKSEDVKLENYITRKTLDGLYLVIAEEEKKIRKDPMGAASDIIRKVFGAVGK